MAPEPPEVKVTGQRRIRLGDGELQIRPIENRDVPGLAALYDGLDPDDRYRRFFSAYHPPSAFFERLTTVAERSGVGLVAVWVPGGGSTEEIVADAEYEMLPNGDGELAITVAASWRGWLGPWLLDALLDAARARGVPNLEADVLATNGPMLALARARGCVSLDRGDWSVVRVLIGATTRVPTWPGGDREPRLLIEGIGCGWRAEHAVRRPGLRVIACPGPTARRMRCPAMAGRPCPLAADANLIVVCLPLDAEKRDELLAAHSILHPGVVVCVDSDASDRRPGVVVLPRTKPEVVAVVRALTRLGSIGASAGGAGDAHQRQE